MKGSVQNSGVLEGLAWSRWTGLALHSVWTVQRPREQGDKAKQSHQATGPLGKDSESNWHLRVFLAPGDFLALVLEINLSGSTPAEPLLLETNLKVCLLCYLSEAFPMVPLVPRISCFGIAEFGVPFTRTYLITYIIFPNIM